MVGTGKAGTGNAALWGPSDSGTERADCACMNSKLALSKEQDDKQLMTGFVGLPMIALLHRGQHVQCAP